MSRGGFEVGSAGEGNALVRSAARDVSKLLRDLAGLPGQREAMLREARHGITRFDPDLADNRSMSLSTKTRLQAARDVDRQLAMKRGWIQSEIDDLRERFGL